MKINWTKNQRKIFNLKDYKKGKIIVNACPGSGKTLCIAKRIINFIKEHETNQSGLAILSFTNVAIEEINEKFKEINKKIETSHEKISYPHFIGTLDSFVNQFIFLPFGHLVMESKKRPILVGEPYNPWHHKNYNDNHFDKISYTTNREIVKIDKQMKLTNEMKDSKEKYTKKGYATQEDANYFATEILEKYPEIAKFIICKFPYVIIDESQDMSFNQMKILDLLIKNGLKNILLVGDPNQAIFKWRTAEPQLFIEKYKEWNKKYKTGIKLEDTFRCNQNISEYLSRLSKSKITSKSDDSFNLKPKIIPHTTNYKEITNEFLNYIKTKSHINTNNTAILFRQKNEINNLFKNNNQYIPVKNMFKDIKKDLNNLKNSSKICIHPKNIQNYTENIIKGEYYILHGNLYRGFEEFEKAYIKTKFKEYNNIKTCIKEQITKNGFYKHRINVLNFIKSFNKPKNKDQLIEDWIKTNNNNFLDKKSKIYLNNIKTKDKTLNIKLNETLTWNNFPIDTQHHETNFYYGTIHSAKGKTFDSVLLILNSNYKNSLGKNLIENEELRNIYVGMSRAKYILHIAVPKNDLSIWKNFFEQTTLI